MADTDRTTELRLCRGMEYCASIAFVQEGAERVPIPQPSGATFRLELRRYGGGPILLGFTGAAWDSTRTEARIVLSAAQTETLPADSLRFTLDYAPDGVTWERFAEGRALVSN